MNEEKKVRRNSPIIVVVASGNELEVKVMDKEAFKQYRENMDSDFDENGIGVDKEGWQCVALRGKMLKVISESETKTKTKVVFE